MKYFIDEKTRKELGGTYYFEFQKGISDEFWKDDSLLLHTEIFDTMGLSKVFREGLGYFDYYGNTVISKEQWDKLYSFAVLKDEETALLFSELNEWAEECYKEYDEMVIKGM